MSDEAGYRALAGLLAGTSVDALDLSAVDDRFRAAIRLVADQNGHGQEALEAWAATQPDGDTILAAVWAADPLAPPDAQPNVIIVTSPKQNDGDDVPRNAADRLASATAPLKLLAERYSAAVEKLAGDYIHLSELTMVVAPPESLKSWLMADLARAVHTGGAWLGSMEVPQGKVLYFEQERARNFVYQTQLLGLGWGQDLSGITTTEPCGIDLCSADWQKAISQMVTAAQPRLVVINSYRAAFHGKPPDSADVALALGWLGHLAERTRCAIVLVDGTNKAGAVGHVRGMAAHGDSIQKEYEADTVLHIERKRDALGRGVGPARLYIGKQRHGLETPPPFSFNAIGHGEGVRLLWLDETGIEDSGERPVSGRDRVLNAFPASGETRSPEELAKAADLTVGSTKNVLTALKREGLIETPRHGHWRRVTDDVASSPTSSSSLF